ncbi:NAD dependent epimerase/dehydratase family protein [Ostertagia ostertagi]
MLVVVVTFIFVLSSVYNVALISSSAFTIDPETGHSSAYLSKIYVMEKERSALSARLDALEKELELLKTVLRKNGTAIQGSGKTFPDVRFRNEEHRKRILVTGGAGFVGSHLVDKLMMDGHEVIALDNYFTGRKRNVERWIGHPNFELVHHDVVNPYFIEVDQIYHLASPASPPHYMYNPVKTIKTNTLGTINMLGLAKLVKLSFLVFLAACSVLLFASCIVCLTVFVFGRVKATILLASTSEIYGDPEVHPQPESYWGHVNTIGPRSCYDEGKRVAESLMVAYNKQERVPIRIARIFNTFGPRMHMNDGRVVSNFIIQALQGNPITIYGDGSQTRSFQYVDDLVDGLILLMNSNCSLPVNLGNPEEYSIANFARIIKDLVGSESSIVNKSSQEDDPQQRKPDISRAAKVLNWQPKVSMRDGLIKTIEYFRDEINEHRRLSSDDD